MMKFLLAFVLFIGIVHSAAFNAGVDCPVLCGAFNSTCGIVQGGFPDITSCVAWCTAVAQAGMAGDTNDVTGNTMGCRYNRAVTNGNCQEGSSVSTVGTCGPIDASAVPPVHSPCTHYCLLETFNGCNETWSINGLPMNVTQCILGCAGAPVGGSFQGGWATNGNMNPWTQNTDTLQCRIYHAAAAILNPNVHCPHAAPHGGGACGTLVQGAAYVCANLDAFCGPPLFPTDIRPYDSIANCVANFSTFDTTGTSTFWGFHNSGSGNDYKCRYYHGGLPVQVAPQTHCAHAGVTSAVCAGATTAPPTTGGTPAPSSAAVASAIFSLIALLLFASF
jgi:hypothetical protein